MKEVGVEVQGMTACPCAQETVRNIVSNEVPGFRKLAGEVPMISHNQRNRTTLMIEVPEHVEVEADDLIDIVESSISSPTFGILKRKDEGNIVLRAHRNPKFVEDVRARDPREAAPEVQGPGQLRACDRSQRERGVIHKQQRLAERVTTAGEL